MERISNVNWQRVLWCCAERRITTDELAVETNLTKATLDRLEAGGDAITYNQLQRIATYFGRGVLFFLEQAPADEKRVFTKAFRTLSNQKFDLDNAVKRIIERAEWQREAYLSLRADTDDFAATSFSPPAIAGLPIGEAAARTRVWLGLGPTNSFDSYRRAIESKGVLVFRTNGYQGKWQIPKSNPILGFSIYHAAFPLIVVKKARFESRQTFTLFHELAHILLHKESTIDDEQDLYQYSGKEREANQFAAQLLIPDELLSHVDVSNVPSAPDLFDDWLRPFRKMWGVSSEAILLRLVDARRLDRAHYEEYQAWQTQQSPEEQPGGTRLYRYREPQHIFGDRYVRTVLSALNEQRITLTKASKFLDGLKVSDLHKLEEYCAGR